MIVHWSLTVLTVLIHLSIGQTKTVKIYRLITRRTYEEKMFEKASMKLGLHHSVLTNMTENVEDGSSTRLKQQDEGPKTLNQLGKQEVNDLLKHGAYDVFRDDEDDESKKFEESDIDSILERSTSTVVDTAAKAAESGNVTSKLASYNTATFFSDNADEDVDVNDPDFWKKLLPEGEEADDLQYLVLEPRQRKQVRRFGAGSDDEDDEELSDDSEMEEDPIEGYKAVAGKKRSDQWTRTWEREGGRVRGKELTL
eukprot:TRINITY_DN1750_c1_g1_i1.p1 TRINITY_DN1750_c1_g1~~TRINITY_DN1750_c1_g1_i1.p1  ORF type:complete len:254 (-),score=112.51 TRINITY_DN1750_c1_g1_i1:958-1719(-)